MVYQNYLYLGLEILALHLWERLFGGVTDP